MLRSKVNIGENCDRLLGLRASVSVFRRWLILAACIALVIRCDVSGQDNVPMFRPGQERPAQPQIVDNRPLVDQEPFDLLRLNEANEFAELKVTPLKDAAIALNLPVPQKPFDFQQEGTVKFKLVEFDAKYWQTPWKSLVEIKLFEDLLLDEAKRLLNEGDFDLCFRTLLYLKNNTELASSIELRQLFDRCLSEDGKRALAQGRFDDALSIYEELYFRNPRFQSSGKSALEIVTECYDRLIEVDIDRRDFLRAQNLVESVRKKYGDRMRDPLVKWERQIDEGALAELARVREVMARNESDAAHMAVRRLVHVLPKLREGHDMYEQLDTQFPHVYVGVTQPAIDIRANVVFDWASRRVGRLTHRWLFEFNGLTDEGGDYLFPNGAFYQADELGLKYRFEIKDDVPFGVPPITTYQISNRLLEIAEIDHPDYYIPWARILKSVEIEDDRRVLVQLNTPYIKPQAMLQVSFMQTTSETYREPNGKYRPIQQTALDTIFERNEIHDPIPGNQHPRIIERIYPTASAADEALIRGEVDIVDRIYPANYNRLSRNPNIVVRPYGVPTLHVLIPNPTREETQLHMKSVNFRRALTYCLDRNSMLRDYVSMGRTIDGYVPVSGPFPVGSDKTEDISYAVNHTIRPRPLSFKLGLVLTSLVEAQEKKRIRAERDRKKQEEMAGLIEPEANGDEDAAQEIEVDDDGNPKEPEIVVPRPTFILAHPDNELVENLCKSMAERWAIIDVKVELRKLPPGVVIPDKDFEYDLLFMEIFMQEPMVDVYQLFGNTGIVSGVDATIKQSLWMLDRANSWGGVAVALRRIHQQTFSGMTILPLWQIMDHYAYRTHLSNVGSNIVHLYQNVENWHFKPVKPKQD